MFKGGPLVPYDFRIIEFTKEEKETWDWYKAQTSSVKVVFGYKIYEFSRLYTFFVVLLSGIESTCNKGTWIEDDSALYMNKEALRFYV